MSMWNKLTEDFPMGLYYLEPVYLYKNNFDNSHYLYITYLSSSLKLVNIVLKVSINNKFKGYWFDSKDWLESSELSYIKRYFNLINYRYVDSYRKSNNAI